MKLQFLCNAHHTHLSNNSQKAYYQWQQSFECGQIYYEEGAWQEAIPHLGCAFEIGDILFSNTQLDKLHGCNLFLSATELLASAYLQLGHAGHCNEVYTMTIKRLEQELHLNKRHKNEISTHLHALYTQYEALKHSRYLLQASQSLNNNPYLRAM